MVKRGEGKTAFHLLEHRHTKWISLECNTANARVLPFCLWSRLNVGHELDEPEAMMYLTFQGHLPNHKSAEAITNHVILKIFSLMSTSSNICSFNYSKTTTEVAGIEVATVRISNNSPQTFLGNGKSIVEAKAIYSQIKVAVQATLANVPCPDVVAAGELLTVKTRRACNALAKTYKMEKSAAQKIAGQVNVMSTQIGMDVEEINERQFELIMSIDATLDMLDCLCFYTVTSQTGLRSWNVLNECRLGNLNFNRMPKSTRCTSLSSEYEDLSVGDFTADAKPLPVLSWLHSSSKANLDSITECWFQCARAQNVVKDATFHIFLKVARLLQAGLIDPSNPDWASLDLIDGNRVARMKTNFAGISAEHFHKAGSSRSMNLGRHILQTYLQQVRSALLCV